MLITASWGKVQSTKSRAESSAHYVVLPFEGDLGLLQVSLLLCWVMGWLHKVMCSSVTAFVRKENNSLFSLKLNAEMWEWPINVSPSRKSSLMHGLRSEGPAQREDKAFSRSVESIKVWHDLLVIYRDRSSLPAVYARSTKGRRNTAFPRARRQLPQEISPSVLEKVGHGGSSCDGSGPF